jgi:hypothetical protein
MPPKGCHGHSIRGSGYVKPDAKDSKMNDDVQRLLAARALQDAKYFPSYSDATNTATTGHDVHSPTVSNNATKGSLGKY